MADLSATRLPAGVSTLRAGRLTWVAADGPSHAPSLVIGVAAALSPERLAHETTVLPVSDVPRTFDA